MSCGERESRTSKGEYNKRLKAARRALTKFEAKNKRLQTLRSRIEAGDAAVDEIEEASALKGSLPPYRRRLEAAMAAHRPTGSIYGWRGTTSDVTQR
jgi:hypothetical protein